MVGLEVPFVTNPPPLHGVHMMGTFNETWNPPKVHTMRDPILSLFTFMTEPNHSTYISRSVICWGGTLVFLTGKTTFHCNGPCENDISWILVYQLCVCVALLLFHVQMMCSLFTVRIIRRSGSLLFLSAMQNRWACTKKHTYISLFGHQENKTMDASYRYCNVTYLYKH